MGLDMFLVGCKSPMYDTNRKEDEYPVREIQVELGYWRKHPNLHGFIVQNFADGVDECQRIYLDSNALDQIASAIREQRLPHTDGFFFGISDTSEMTRKTDLDVIERARAWLEKVPHTNLLTPIAETDTVSMYQVESPPPNQEDFRIVYYQASW